MAKSIYVGKLATRIDFPDSPSQEDKAEIQRELAERIRLVCSHHHVEIRDGVIDWIDLGFKLMMAHVPCFQRCRVGRKPTRYSAEMMSARQELHRVVSDIQLHRKQSDVAACRHLNANRDKLPEQYRNRKSLTVATLRADLLLGRKEARRDLARALAGNFTPNPGLPFAINPPLKSE